MDIKLEKLLAHFGIKEKIFISRKESKDESKGSIKEFMPVKYVEGIIILSDSDGSWVTEVSELNIRQLKTVITKFLFCWY